MTMTLLPVQSEIAKLNARIDALRAVPSKNVTATGQMIDRYRDEIARLEPAAKLEAEIEAQRKQAELLAEVAFAKSGPSADYVFNGATADGWYAMYC